MTSMTSSMARGDRTATFRRVTNETSITGSLDLDAGGRKGEISTGIGMLDHMLDALATHARIRLDLQADGDLQVDDHHVAEDCAIALGRLLGDALGDRRGIERFGWAMVPLDESLARVSIDLVSRPSASVELDLARPMIGTLASENAVHFLETLALTAPFTLHVKVLEGRNDHHRLEAAFKSMALALRAAIRPSGIETESSTKGTLL